MTGESLPVVLVDRLRAALGELETLARTAADRWPPRLAYDRPQSKAAIALMKAHDPAPVLLTIQAHRKIIDEALQWQHVWIEDCWYSCGLAVDPSFPDEPPGSGCCNDNTPTECTCGVDDRRDMILAALASIYFPESDGGTS